jgi:hypothetical protein
MLRGRGLVLPGACRADAWRLVAQSTSTDAGLPRGGVLIADLRPAQLHMLIGKVAQLASERGMRLPRLLAALQAER